MVYPHSLSHDEKLPCLYHITDQTSEYEFLCVCVCVWLSLWVDEKEISLKAGIYSLLAHICIDKADWKGALRMLDQVIRDTPYTKDHLWVRSSTIRHAAHCATMASLCHYLTLLCVSPGLCLNKKYCWKHNWGKTSLLTFRSCETKESSTARLCGTRWRSALAVKPSSSLATRKPSPLCRYFLCPASVLPSFHVPDECTESSQYILSVSLTAVKMIISLWTLLKSLLPSCGILCHYYCCVTLCKRRDPFNVATSSIWVES